MGFCPHLWHAKIFFKNWAQSLLYPYGALTSCKKLEKTYERSLEIFKDGKTDGQANGQTKGPTNGQERLLRTPSGKLGVQNDLEHVKPKFILIYTARDIQEHKQEKAHNHELKEEKLRNWICLKHIMMIPYLSHCCQLSHANVRLDILRWNNDTLVTAWWYSWSTKGDFAHSQYGWLG